MEYPVPKAPTAMAEVEVKYPAAMDETEAEVEYSVAMANVVMVKAEGDYPAAMAEAESKYPAAMSASRPMMKMSRSLWSDGEAKLVAFAYLFCVPMIILICWVSCSSAGNMRSVVRQQRPVQTCKKK